jgi:MSHA biogenesis protein MshG
MSEGAVGESLIKTGIFPISIEEHSESSKNDKGLSPKKINIINFTRQLYILIRSGIPISKALKSLEVSTQEVELKELFKDVRANLDNGYELNTSLQKYPKVFNKFYINMVRIGELTGRLEQVLLELYDFLKFESEMKKRAKSAIRYPILLLSVMAIAFSVIMVFVIPVFADVYKGFNAELPWPTKILINTSSFVITYGIFILMAIGLGIKMFINYIKTPIGSMWWGKFKFNLPIIGKILKKSALARFTKGFSLSLKSGIPVLQGLSNVQNILENVFVEKHIEDIKHSIQRGNTLYNSMQNTNIFEPLVLEMMATGEESGELEAMCDEVSLYYDEEIIHELGNLNSYIEPLMLLFLGGLLLILALGVFLPIWDLSTVVIKK